MQGLWKLLKYLVKLSNSRWTVVAIALAGIISGGAQAGLIALVSKSFGNGDTSKLSLVLTFSALCIGLPTFRYLSQWMLIKLTSKTFFALRLDMSRRLLGSPQRHLEELGKARIVDTLMNDVTTIINALARVPLVAMHLSVIIALLLYLAWISWPLLLLLLVMIFIGVGTYELIINWSRRYQQQALQHRRRLVQLVEELALGSKELKMNHHRERKFIQDLSSSAKQLHQVASSAQKIYAAASAWGQSLFLSPWACYFSGCPMS